jgi:hypothetical protein
MGDEADYVDEVGRGVRQALHGVVMAVCMHLGVAVVVVVVIVRRRKTQDAREPRRSRFANLWALALWRAT